MTRVDLPAGRILHAHNFERAGAPPGLFYLDFAAEGAGEVRVVRLRRRQVHYRFNPAALTISVDTERVRFDGTVLVGGSGGATAQLVAMGIGIAVQRAAGRLLASRHGILRLFADGPGEVPRRLDLDVPGLSPRAIAERLGPARTTFMDYWTSQLIERLEGLHNLDAERAQAISAITVMSARGWLGPGQKARIEHAIMATT